MDQLGLSECITRCPDVIDSDGQSRGEYRLENQMFTSDTISYHYYHYFISVCHEKNTLLGEIMCMPIYGY